MKLNANASRLVFISVTALSSITVAAAAEPTKTQLNLLTFNTINAGQGLETPVANAFEKTIEVIKASQADIACLNEVKADVEQPDGSWQPDGPSVANKIASALNFNVFDQSSFYAEDAARTNNHPALWADSIISRFPIEGGTPSGYGAQINVNGQKVHVFCLNMDYKPYPAYQINNIEYEGYPFIKTEKEAIHYANMAHKAGMDILSAEINTVAKSSAAVFVMGDFNEPSHRDWTAKAVQAKLQPVKVAWPTTSGLESLGFVDTYRAAHPDEVSHPGLTWTPTTAENDPEDHHDRIDYVFAKAPGLAVLRSAVLGEKSERADIVITPWPSDHRAVVSTVAY